MTDETTTNDSARNDYDPSTNPQGPNLPWYDATPKSIDPSTRALLETYSGIPPEKVEEHIIDIRNRAFKIYSYPCLGQFRFLDLSIGKAKQYPEALERVKAGETLIDLGCCLGQDLRRLVADGAPSDRLIGADLQPGFHELGRDLFADADTFKGTLVAADMTLSPDDEASSLHAFVGGVDMVHASSFYHLFDYSTQLLLAKHTAALLRSRAGSMVFGRQVGSAVAHVKSSSGGGKDIYRHNAESWRGMWEKAATSVGRQVEVEVELSDVQGWTDRGARDKWDAAEGTKRLRYCVRFL